MNGRFPGSKKALSRGFLSKDSHQGPTSVVFTGFELSNDSDKISSLTSPGLLPGEPVVGRRAFLASAAAATIAVLGGKIDAKPRADLGNITELPVMMIAQLIRSRELSSVEVVKAHLDRIEVVNPKIHAVCALAAERALDEARRADEQLALGNIKGVLHGVPMTFKDSFDTEDIVSTAGTLGRKTFIPKQDATIVRRLRESGAILLGKTNTPEFTMSFDTRNLLFEYTLNPYDLSMSPGGSSGGAAAIIAACGSPFDFGTDTGGSIRVPSSFCGIAGIKPTAGLLPLTGHIVNCDQRALAAITQAGPMSRYVDDLYPLLKVTAGPDGKDTLVRSIPLRDPSLVNLKELRTAFHTDNGIRAASAEVKKAVLAGVLSLSDLGAKIEESCPKILTGLEEFSGLPYSSDGGEWARKLLKRCGTTTPDPHMNWLWSSEPLSSEEVERRIGLWNRYRSGMNVWMSGYDVLICPTNSEASYPTGFDQSDMKGFTYTEAFNLTGWPAAVVRGGTSRTGMPIGVQIVANYGREDICLAVAKHLQTSLGGWTRPSRLDSV